MDIKTERRVSNVADDGSLLVTTTNEISFNVNWEVRVKLTEHGLEQWRHHFEELFKGHDKVSLDFEGNVSHHDLGNGWYKFQLYELCQIFGPSFPVFMSSDLPFETEIKLIQTSTDFYVPAPEGG